MTSTTTGSGASIDQVVDLRDGVSVATPPPDVWIEVTKPPADKPLRGNILLVASSGGHLTQLLALEPWWRHHERSWVTFDGSQARSLLADETVHWAYHPTTRNVRNMLRNLYLASKTLRRSRPDLIVSTGAGVAVPFFVVARMLGIPAVFIEVYDRIEMPTLTGRLVRPFATAFLVQWEEQRRTCPEAVFVGALL